MPSLREVQHAVRRGLLCDTDALVPAAIAGAGLVPAGRLSVYRNTMLGTLSNALRLSFPAVQHLVGAEFFEAAAQDFVRERPPACADLNAYGAEFPQFLRRFPPAATLAYLPDVASLEWAVNRALHAPDMRALDLSQLAAVTPGDQDRVRFVANPSISMLRSSFPVDAIWHAVLRRDEAAMAAIDLSSGPVGLLVERLAGEVEVTRLPEAEWCCTAALLEGQPLATALAVAGGIDAAALLAQHLAAGRCIGFHLDTA